MITHTRGCTRSPTPLPGTLQVPQVQLGRLSGLPHMLGVHSAAVLMHSQSPLTGDCSATVTNIGLHGG
jgi:hypothetical protein